MQTATMRLLNTYHTRRCLIMLNIGLSNFRDGIKEGAVDPPPARHELHEPPRHHNGREHARQDSHAKSERKALDEAGAKGVEDHAGQERGHAWHGNPGE